MKSVVLIGSNGYIGSSLADHLSADPGLRLVTCDESTSAANSADYVCNSSQLPDELIRAADTVLFFGGCSSVSAAMNDPAKAIDKNLLELLTLARTMGAHQHLVYASSASVYSSPHSSDYEGLVPLSTETSLLRPPENAYDATKQAFDLIAPYLLVSSLGLRLGTLSGMSRRLRSELVFNSMTIAALTERRVRLQNSSSSRSLLFLDDLHRLIREIIENPTRTEHSQVLNVASLSATFGELAHRIAGHLNASVEVLPDSRTYSFAMDTSLMHEIHSISSSGLEEQIDKFSLEYGTVKK